MKPIRRTWDRAILSYIGIRCLMVKKKKIRFKKFPVATKKWVCWIFQSCSISYNKILNIMSNKDLIINFRIVFIYSFVFRTIIHLVHIQHNTMCLNFSKVFGGKKLLALYYSSWFILFPRIQMNWNYFLNKQ
jgi:hypothetical protein